MDKLLKCVDSLSSELERYVFSLPETYKDTVEEFVVLYNLAVCGRVLAREKFLPESFAEILHDSGVTSDCAIDNLTLGSEHFSDDKVRLATKLAYGIRHYVRIAQNSGGVRGARPPSRDSSRLVIRG
eukprot:jgi/Mesvir1/7568/Mv04535-RA.1